MTDTKKGSKKKSVYFSLYYKNSKKNFFFKTNNLLKIDEKNQKSKMGLVIAHGNPIILYFFIVLSYMVIFLIIKFCKNHPIFIPDVTTSLLNL